MKKTSILLTTALVVLTTVSLSAQKYKIKDDIITRDKAPVGKVVGDAGFDKTNLQILGNNGEKLITVTAGIFNIKNPFFSYINWYTIRFEDSGKQMRIPHAGSCGTKCFLNNALAPTGVVLDGAAVKDQDAIIAKSDISEKIKNDTTAILNKHNLWVSLLGKNQIIRDLQKQVVLVKVSESTEVETTTTVYNIAQDNIVIGRIVKDHLQSSTRIQTDYTIYEKLYQPEGAITEVPAGKVTDTFMALEFMTVVDGKTHKMDIQDKANAQNSLATYFVNKGYL